jgi:hypothetical protein
MANAERKRLTAMGLLVALALAALLWSAAGSATPTVATTSHRRVAPVVMSVATHHPSMAPRAGITVLPPAAAVLLGMLLSFGIVRLAGPGRPRAGVRRLARARAPPA